MPKPTKEELNNAIRDVLPVYFDEAVRRVLESPPLPSFDPEAPVTQQDLRVYMTAFQWALVDAIVEMLGDGKWSI